MTGCRCRTRAAPWLLLALLASCTSGPPLAEPAAAPEPVAVPAGPDEGGSYAAGRWQQQTRDAFRRLDRDRDGKLDLAELRAGMAVLDADGDGRIGQGEAGRMVPAGDRDKDGRLSAAELANLPAFPLETDRDGDGRISALEFSLARTDDFVRADQNRDGRLSREEWTAVARFTLFRF